MSAGYIEALGLAIVVGLSLGALGSGGSIITTPVLVYVAGIPPEVAVGMSLVIVGTTSLVGSLLQLRRGNLAPKAALMFAATGMVGSFIGSHGTHLLSSRTLMLLFSCTMLVVGLVMLRGIPGLQKPASYSTPRCLLVGFGVGLLTGFLGVGGGFLIVPALFWFGGLDSGLAAGTSLAVIAMNSSTGLLGQLRFVRVDWILLYGFLTFALIGMVVGITLSHRLPEARLRRIFATTVLAIGVAVGLENLL